MLELWKNSLGDQFSLKEILNIIASYPKSQIHVGTDSHYKSGQLIFATVIAIYSPGVCSRYFFKRRLEKSSWNNRKSLSARLLKEVQNSIDIASELRELLESEYNISVHADISSNVKNGSNIVYEPAKRWIVAMGFNCCMKPLAWASSSIADLHAK